MATKNLGNVVGLYKGITPPMEADGVTEKRYVLWAKEMPTVPPVFQIQYYDYFLGVWSPLLGVKQSEFDLLKYRLFGTLNDVDLPVEIGAQTVMEAIQKLNETTAGIDAYASLDYVNQKIAELINGAGVGTDSFGEIEQKLLELLQSDAGFFTQVAQAAYAQSVTNTFATKMGFPAAIFKTDDYVMSGAGNPLLISSIMQNIYKNNGALTGNRELDLAGFTFTFKNLVDKSADASFNKLLGLDATGKIAMVNGATVLKVMPSLLSEAEKTNWKTEMNGGWTTNAMSVAIILPPIVDSQDKNYWITLKGANLNLNPVSFSLEIMDSTGTTVITTVPNSQVQLYQNGTDLVFYYNFKDLAVGNYRVRLWNGVAHYVTHQTINVVALLTPVSLSGLTWSMINSHIAPTVDLTTASGTSIHRQRNTGESYANSQDVVSFKSSTLIPASIADGDFYLEVTATIAGVVYYDRYYGHDFGIVNAEDTLSHSMYIISGLRKAAAIQDLLLPSGTNVFSGNPTDRTTKIYIVKKNNVISITGICVGNVVTSVDTWGLPLGTDLAFFANFNSYSDSNADAVQVNIYINSLIQL